jgi:hypothetical protein
MYLSVKIQNLNQCRLVKNWNADDTDASSADLRGFFIFSTNFIRVLLSVIRVK